MRNYACTITSLLLMMSSAYAQHATGRSIPGRLGKPPEGRDFTPPRIVFTNAGGAVLKNERGIKVNPRPSESITGLSDGSGFILLQGLVKDNRQVASLQGNSKNLGLQGTAQEKRFSVRLREPGFSKLSSLIFVATDGAGNSSRMDVEIKGPTYTDSLTCVYIKSGGEPENPDPANGAYWALIIGVNDYEHPSLQDLNYPVKDAQDVFNVLTQYYIFEPNRVKFLPNPRRAQLIGALSDYAPSGANPLGKDDNLLVYYAGHGHFDKDFQEGYWLPADAEAGNRGNWVSNPDIQSVFSAIKARHILLLLDACFSGSIFATTRNAFEAPENRAYIEAYKEPSRKAITSGNFTTVPDSSVFKYFLVKQLIENSNDYLDAATLYNKIKTPITNNSITRQRPIYNTIQNTGDEGGEFIFVRRE